MSTQSFKFCILNSTNVLEVGHKPHVFSNKFFFIKSLPPFNKAWCYETTREINSSWTPSRQNHPHYNVQAWMWRKVFLQWNNRGHFVVHMHKIYNFVCLLGVNDHFEQKTPPLKTPFEKSMQLKLTFKIVYGISPWQALPYFFFTFFWGWKVHLVVYLTVLSP